MNDFLGMYNLIKLTPVEIESLYFPNCLKEIEIVIRGNPIKDIKTGFLEEY